MSQPSQSDINAGQKIYNPWTLKLYNLVVLWFSNNWAWRCSRYRQLQHYQQHISDKHLDVGVGTGYYLDRVTFKNTTPQLTLMDLMEDKKIIIENLAKKLSPNCVLFGSTILGKDVAHNFIGKKLMTLYNKKKFFDNQNDSETELKKILENYFKNVQVEVIGAVALFTATHPQTPSPRVPS